MDHVEYPSDHDLLCYFGVEPERRGDAYYYSSPTTGDVTVRLGFNPVEDTITTVVELPGGGCISNAYEGVTQMRIDGDVLSVECRYGSGRVRLALTVGQPLQLAWTGLRIG